ncbi:MAG: hypothetical protein DRP70_04495 [Spirochaetes bacterium]|nr:MAG: hypothetical protein DRP60_03490 [Spirochaetota bacterium]RKX89176.1 MAG: hypothetical protein DRP70_04495 [Spirochaetota bacterium]
MLVYYQNMIGRSFFVASALILMTTFQVAGNPLPKPKNRESSLLMIVVVRDSEVPGNRGVRIVIEGEQRYLKRIGGEDWDLLTLRIQPGEYTVHPVDNSAFKLSGSENLLQVPPDTVLLAPFKLRITVDDSAGGSGTQKLILEPNNEEDRQRAGRVLASYVRFPDWAVKDLKGFGLIRPALISVETLYDFNILSEPTGAEAYIDGLLMGQTPLNISLTPGKKQLQFKMSGREDVIRYINPGESDFITGELPLLVEGADEDRNAFTLVVSPFLSMRGADPQLSSLFSESIMFVLEEDSRLSVGSADIPWINRGALMLPDFSILEDDGTDLVASGLFLRDENGLTIQANLYDVRNETIKAGVRWSGTVGLDIFDAVDEISASFEKEVDRVLPEAGKTLITRQETIFTGSSDDERLLAGRRVIQARQTWRHLLSIDIGVPVIDEEITLDNGSELSTFSGRFGGSSFTAGMEWEWLGNGDYLGTMAGFRIINAEKYSEPATEDRFTDYMLYGAARLNLRASRSDLYFGLGSGLSFSPKESYTVSTPSVISDEIGPFLSLSARMDLGFRGYMNQRAAARPVFWSLKMYLSLYEYRFDLAGDGNNGRVPVNFGICIGMGMGL